MSDRLSMGGRKLPTVSGFFRWAMVCAGAYAFVLPVAQAETVAKPPRPQPKPAISAPAVKSTSTVPIPRAKPVPGDQKSKAEPALKPGDPITANRRGRLEVKLNDLGRERDPDKASNLTAKITTKWSKKAVAKARARCAFVLAATNLDAKQVDPIGGPKGCGIAAPIQVTAFGAVTVKPAAKLNCTMAANLYKWIVETVQPAARSSFKQAVVEIQNMSSYTCRTRRGVAGGRISEHSFGNALDIGSFKLSDGQKLSVLDDWSSTLSFFGADPKSKFLAKTHSGACKKFSTVLGPKANKAHKNHFHFDLGRGGRNRICK